MHSSIKSEEEKKEYFDSPEELDKKCELLAQMIKESKHFVAFTGAGISTASGIPDYRSGADTKLKTGAGCWEDLANIEKARKEGKLQYKPANKREMGAKIQQAYPSKTHMAMVKLMNEGYLKHIASQNVDGLHRKSGIGADKVSELHGNTNLEICEKCGKDYMRDYRTRTAKKCKEHKTGRLCDDRACRGYLHDSIINFGENLKADVIDRGFSEGNKCDLMVAMGSSLRVTPACNIVEDAGQRKRQKLVIVNLQKTPMDHLADLVIHGFMDDVIELVMKKLDLYIPQFKLDRWAQIELEESKSGKETVKVSGIDKLGGPFDLFTKVLVNNRADAVTLREAEMKEDSEIEVALSFQGHYNEQSIIMKVPRKTLKANNNTLKVNMICNPYRSGIWELAAAYTSQGEALGPL